MYRAATYPSSSETRCTQKEALTVHLITSKKGEEYQTEQFESTLLKRLTKEEKARKRTRGPYRPY